MSRVIHEISLEKYHKICYNNNALKESRAVFTPAKLCLEGRKHNVR